MALNITVTSYNGHLDWGIVVDRDIVDDPWAMYDGRVESGDELLELARPSTAAKPRRAPTTRSRSAGAKRLTAAAS